MRFTLNNETWYACEFIGDEFQEDCCSYSPIKVRDVVPLRTGGGKFRLAFYHANYPAGVREKEYELAMIERGQTFLLAKSVEHDPPRILQIYDIDWNWVVRHFHASGGNNDDVQRWLETNA